MPEPNAKEPKSFGSGAKGVQILNLQDVGTGTWNRNHPAHVQAELCKLSLATSKNVELLHCTEGTLSAVLDVSLDIAVYMRGRPVLDMMWR